MPLVKADQADQANQANAGGSGFSSPFENGAGEERIHKIEVGGSAVKFDDLGPIIINEDGTMRRIANWHLLTDLEKEVTQRRITKRNQERIKAIQERASEDQVQDIGDERDEILLLPEATGELMSPLHAHGDDGSNDASWPPPETDGDEHFPPRTMF